MTSFMIQSHVNRKASHSWNQDDNCPFCQIIAFKIPAWRIFENDDLIVVLDIMPLRKGHSLVIPKSHHSRVSELPPALASAAGEAISRVALALRQGLGITGLNIVCNEEYAQAVPHVHYHIIPAPDLNSPAIIEEATEMKVPRSIHEMHVMEYAGRGELDTEEAEELINKIRPRL